MNAAQNLMSVFRQSIPTTAKADVEAAMHASGIVDCTLGDAYVLAYGDGEAIEMLIERKPHLKLVEDFINHYLF